MKIKNQIKIAAITAVLSGVVACGSSSSSPQPTGPAQISINAAGSYPQGYKSVANLLLAIHQMLLLPI